MNLEIEVRGFVESEAEFNSFIQKFQREDYEYSFVKRLSVVSGDYKLRNLETRLRITDGKITLAQKKGDIGAITREEIEFPLNINMSEFIKLSKIIYNQSKQIEESYCILAMHDNYLFKSDELEIKLFRQHGKGEFFGYEVEINNISEQELENKVVDLGFQISEGYDSDSAVRQRNSEINFPFTELSSRQLEQIIEDYF